jgi:hypothetical protein
MVAPGRTILKGTSDPAFAAAEGTRYLNTTSGVVFFNADGSASGWYALRTASGLDLEDQYAILRPYYIDDADTGRSAQTNLEGAVYHLLRRMTVNRVYFQINSQSGSPTMAFGLYQTKGGKISTAIDRRINVTSQAVSSTGILAVTVSEVTLDKGPLFTLAGRDSVSDSFTFATWATTARDLETDNIPTGINAYPTIYRTSIAATTGPPATFDPRETGDGGDAIEASVFDCQYMIALGKV